MKNALSSKKGISMSQAQSVSNLLNQRALEISNKISGINNYSKKMKVDGEDVIILAGKSMPEDIKELILEKANLHSAQAFLMENIKAKENLMNELRWKSADFGTTKPEAPELVEYKLIQDVDESWGYNQLSSVEQIELLNADQHAAHIGKFIHKGGTLDLLRKELPTIPSVEFYSLEEYKKSVVKVVTHHSAEELLDLHEEFVKLHRKHEARVNYFKAKIKNLTSLENSRIQKENAVGIRKQEEANSTIREE